MRAPAVLALVAVLLAPPEAGAAPAPASPLPPARRLDQVLARLREHRQRLHVARARERRLLRELEGIDRTREQAEIRLRDLAREQQETEQRLRKTAADLAATERRLRDRRARLGERLRDIYTYGRSGYADVLLGADDFVGFITRWRLVTAVVRADTAALEEYAADARRHRELIQALERDRVVLRALAAQAAARRDELAAQERAKRTLLDRVQTERAAYEQVVRELEQASRELEALIRRAQQPARARVAEARVPFAFAWPARGVFTSWFGVRRHPLFGIRHLHRGVDIAAPHGAPVLAAAPGRVIYAGWFGGYGKIVIVDHGGGVSTLYGHLSTILVRPPDPVRRGQPIGRVGSTGYSTGPHVHFEIRIDGVPVDPDRL
ncbi:MAG: peptidoglycan DD-metalloendopeptidase family protein [Armatimonadota bacterium]|nr:peptidoglycan DD-metalloendopeptidase family protein [Armatimonadota bacterium]MDR7400925.1 peptidoglycan DD-metalloendopeptidase family protein [Armatimonadota bacterium]MDR7437357.1 peptidoglycan DD-metalloendopeptidase family protein [Armatimonadota bacterium]MDR7472827.1 peptidoglycan DD-metalloendopeptidase family protein [Armatimonadota bacterium]MDR7506822.1 peptidoglycan DD-metalloendopeptidase family protein [Armatimonadota bacterium]